MSKAQKIKNKQEQNKFNFKIFENYKCDGQYAFDFSNNHVNIVEEHEHLQPVALEQNKTTS